MADAVAVAVPVEYPGTSMESHLVASTSSGAPNGKNHQDKDESKTKKKKKARSMADTMARIQKLKKYAGDLATEIHKFESLEFGESDAKDDQNLRMYQKLVDRLLEVREQLQNRYGVSLDGDEEDDSPAVDQDTEEELVKTGHTNLDALLEELQTQPRSSLRPCSDYTSLSAMVRRAREMGDTALPIEADGIHDYVSELAHKLAVRSNRHARRRIDRLFNEYPVDPDAETEQDGAEDDGDGRQKRFFDELEAAAIAEKAEHGGRFVECGEDADDLDKDDKEEEEEDEEEEQEPSEDGEPAKSSAPSSIVVLHEPTASHIRGDLPVDNLNHEEEKEDNDDDYDDENDGGSSSSSVVAVDESGVPLPPTAHFVVKHCENGVDYGEDDQEDDGDHIELPVQRRNNEEDEDDEDEEATREERVKLWLASAPPVEVITVESDEEDESDGEGTAAGDATAAAPKRARHN